MVIEKELSLADNDVMCFRSFWLDFRLDLQWSKHVDNYVDKMEEQTGLAKS